MESFFHWRWLITTCWHCLCRSTWNAKALNRFRVKGSRSTGFLHSQYRSREITQKCLGVLALKTHYVEQVGCKYMHIAVHTTAWCKKHMLKLCLLEFFIPWKYYPTYWWGEWKCFIPPILGKDIFQISASCAGGETTNIQARCSIIPSVFKSLTALTSVTSVITPVTSITPVPILIPWHVECCLDNCNDGGMALQAWNQTPLGSR